MSFFSIEQLVRHHLLLPLLTLGSRCNEKVRNYTGCPGQNAGDFRRLKIDIFYQRYRTCAQSKETNGMAKPVVAIAEGELFTEQRDVIR